MPDNPKLFPASLTAEGLQREIDHFRRKIESMDDPDRRRYFRAEYLTPLELEQIRRKEKNKIPGHIHVYRSLPSNTPQNIAPNIVPVYLDRFGAITTIQTGNREIYGWVLEKDLPPLPKDGRPREAGVELKPSLVNNFYAGTTETSVVNLATTIKEITSSTPQKIYPQLRLLVKDRYAWHLNVPTDLHLLASEPKIDIDALSKELIALEMPHTISVGKQYRSLKLPFYDSNRFLSGVYEILA